MNTYHIHINGIVQGVGFRPLVYNVAKEMQVNGYVKNGSDGLHVFLNSSSEMVTEFLKRIQESAPSSSKIIFSSLNKIEDKNFSNFSILVEDDDINSKEVLLSPDIAMCDECKNELHDVNNKRYRYPFITCTQCGPRYSIINHIPYDRHNTFMHKFKMCSDCKDEYDDIRDRRFFSQTNSCEKCGIELSLLDNTSTILTNDSEEVLSILKKLLNEGKIIAVKGLGGYLLLCDANNTETIILLRQRKLRPAKPFAVLYPDIKSVQENFYVNMHEENLLQSSESPIVLLYPQSKIQNNISAINIAPGLKRLGVMLPYNPLLDLIVKDFAKPLIATSANISGSTIIYKDDEAPTYLFDIADYIVSHDREIAIPQDDSVVQVSKHLDQQIILRRSRGYAPSFLSYKPLKEDCIIGTGAFLKSSFTLSVNRNVFISQFLGSTESYESQQIYKDTLRHWLGLYNITPAVILSDKHPRYFSHLYAVELSEIYQAKIKFIQHHKAHFAAILSENYLINSTEPILGVIWDGTGFGDDGNIWGGEFFKYENNEMLRCYHFDYFPSIAGDKIVSEPRIAALCASQDVWHQSNIVKEKFTGIEWNNYQSLISDTNLFSSSVGRIFDAVASLLGLCDKQTYEGEAAMYLQTLAESYVDENGFEINESYFKEDAHYYRISTSTLMQGIILDIQKKKLKNYIAAKFHYSLACLIEVVAKNTGVKKICFSGGVFQNALLVDWIHCKLSDKYELYFHKNLSPNDENISYGQLIYYDNNIQTSFMDSNNKLINENLNLSTVVI